MNKSFKKSKLKVWRKCYGKPFIARRAVCVAQMAMTTAMAAQQVSHIGCFGGNAALKSVAVARCVMVTIDSLKDKSHEMNKGFVNNE